VPLTASEYRALRSRTQRAVRTKSRREASVPSRRVASPPESLTNGPTAFPRVAIPARPVGRAQDERRRLAWARSSIVSAGMSVDHSVISRPDRAGYPRRCHSREATAAQNQPRAAHEMRRAATCS